MSTPEIFPRLAASLMRARSERDRIDSARRQQLDALVRSINERIDADSEARLIFICTHNSRRSHLSQLWAQAAAIWNGRHDIACFSGGTETTAFNPSAVQALRNAGFEIETATHDTNPRYDVRYAVSSAPLVAFSKKYDHASNPSDGFIAVMTCSQADDGCPVVLGAAQRISLPYGDPKEADGTPLEAAVYEERSRQIAREMVYVMDALASNG
ncbi:MAG: protein-tyrosine-phosphatase [Bacteroidia bacterium]|nr:protein-tyrosine-phosphatase [Bacteroidia bacterium]